MHEAQPVLFSPYQKGYNDQDEKTFDSYPCQNQCIHLCWITQKWEYLPTAGNFLITAKIRSECLNWKATNDKRELFVARSKHCLKITSESANFVEKLKTDHEEADTKLVYLIQHAQSRVTSWYNLHNSFLFWWYRYPCTIVGMHVNQPRKNLHWFWHGY